MGCSQPVSGEFGGALFLFFHLLGLARCSELDSVCDLAISSIYTASIYGCILHIRKNT